MSQYYQAVGGGQGPLECSIMTGTINMVFIKDAFIPIVFGVLGFLRILNFVTDINRFCLKYIMTLLCVLSDIQITCFTKVAAFVKARSPYSLYFEEHSRHCDVTLLSVEFDCFGFFFI